MRRIGTDGVCLGQKPHPRLYGTFPRVLAEYVKKKQVLTLQEAIHKMSCLPSKVLGISDLGLTKEGMFADIVVFDKGKFTGECPGRVFRLCHN